MDVKGKTRYRQRIIGLLIGLGAAIVFTAGSVAAHGGKTHSAGAFTRLQAAQKAIGLYDRLISAGKLKEPWETGLETIAVFESVKSGVKEVAVSAGRGARRQGCCRKIEAWRCLRA